MYYIGLDVHKKAISYCVKDASGRVHQEGKLGATRRELDIWMRTLPQPWTVAMEATIFTGWIYAKVRALPATNSGSAAFAVCPESQSAPCSTQAGSHSAGNRRS